MLTNVVNIGALAISSDNLTMMWQVPILGMAMVFAVLGILWAVLAIFKLVFAGKTPKAEKPQKAPKAPKETKVTPKKASDVADAELMAVLSAAVAAHQNSDEIIAAITAAVSAYREEVGETGGFRVVAFKRAGSRTWNRR